MRAHASRNSKINIATAQCRTAAFEMLRHVVDEQATRLYHFSQNEKPVFLVANITVGLVSEGINHERQAC
jgi:hypothetical protein